ncbi:MAG: sulfatase-like hydrolase/transferase [Vicinamibacteria bacterium]
MRMPRPRRRAWLAVALAASCAGAAALWLRPAALSGGSRAQIRNVLLVTLDTTRADHLGVYGARRARTPHLDALAREGAWFARASSSIPLTLPAHAGLMTGASPLRHGLRDNHGAALEAGPTLAERLREAGFATGGFVGSLVLARSTGIARGFDAFDDAIGETDPRRSERDGALVVERALAFWEARASERVFAWVHLYDPHLPYEPRGELAREYADDPYAGEVAYVDGLVGRLLDFLRRRGLYESTLIVVTADHGEGLGEHGEPDHGVFLYESTLRVPLLVRAPGGGPGRVDALVRDVDVMPTILDWLGLAPPPPADGRSFASLLRGGSAEPRTAVALSDYARDHYGWSPLAALRDERYKYVAAPEPELYDLGQDPGETRNLAAERAPLAERMRLLLGERLASASRPAAAASDPEREERLRALGYAGGVVRSLPAELPDPKRRVASLALFSRVAGEALDLLEAGRAAEALPIVDAALAREPRYLDGHLLRARALMALSRHAPAVRSLETARALNPRDASTLFDLAGARAAKGDLDTALALLGELRQLEPGGSRAFFAEATLRRARGDLDGALRTMRELAGLGVETAEARLEIGRLLLAQGRRAQARREIEAVLALQAGIETAHYNLALIAEQEDDRATARREYERELQLFPRNEEAWQNLGVLLLEQGEVAAAERAFRRVVEIRPELAAGHAMLARALAQRGFTAEATRAAREAARLERGTAGPGRGR